MVIEQIISLVSSALLILTGSVLYVFVITSVLPYFFLMPKYSKRGTTDRGLKKYEFPEGRGIVYEPAVKYRKYIKKYLLFEYKGDKFIKCKPSNDVSAIKYDVVVYGVRNEIIKYLELSELISVRGTAKNVLLPKETSYAMVIVRNVNGHEIPCREPIKSISFLNKAIFAAATVVLTVVIGLLWRGYFANLITIMGSDPGASTFMTLLVSLGAGAILAAVGILFHGAKRTWKE